LSVHPRPSATHAITVGWCDTFSLSILNPLSKHISSNVSVSSGWKGLKVRSTVLAYPLTANAATRRCLSGLPGGSQAAWSSRSEDSSSSANFWRAPRGSLK
jgi:hypothetical protein